MKAKKKYKCPHCEGPVSRDARLCVHCNGPLVDLGLEAKTPFCPRCRKKLKTLKVEGGDRAEACKSCHGLWLDYQEFKMTTHPGRISKKYIESSKHWHKPSFLNPIQYVPCPRCGRLMNRINFSKISGIMLDQCRDHGVWLDAGELERIRLFIGSGGLERFQDKRLDMLEEKFSHLAHRTRQLEFTSKLLHYWNFKRIIFQGLSFR